MWLQVTARRPSRSAISPLIPGQPRGAAFPGSGYGEAAGAFNGNVFVVGGDNTQATWIYNIAANTWSAGTAAPAIYYVGGYQQVGQYLYMLAATAPPR